MEFRFASPLFLSLLIIPFVVYAWPRLRRQLPQPATLRYSDTRLVNGSASSWRLRLHWLPDVLRGLAWMLLVISLARPQMGNAREVLRGQGIDIVLSFDISDSMASPDFEPENRLEAAKTVMEAFINGREFDRIGLVAFALNAYHQAPLTLDYDVLRLLLNEVRLASEIPEVDGGATAIGLGVASAANMLRTSEAASRVIVLLTDGDNNTSLDPVVAAEAAAAFDIRIYTIGMGQRGIISVPVEGEEPLLVESDLNEELLQDVASVGGGVYYNVADLEDLQGVFAQIDRLERSTIRLQTIVRWQERAWMFLWGALTLLIVERVLRRTVFQSIP